MSTKLNLASAALCLGVALATVGMAQAAPTVQAADHVEQHAIDLLARGDDALASNHQKAALVAIEQAQTALLNAQQAGTYKAPQAIAALENAHADVVKGKLSPASGLVRSAEGDLKTPKIG